MAQKGSQTLKGSGVDDPLTFYFSQEISSAKN